MTNQIGIRGWGLAILAIVTVGCASPYAYYGDAGCGPIAISGRHADCSSIASEGCGAEGCDAEGCDAEGCDAEGCDAEPCGRTCGAGGPCRLRDTLACNAGCGRMYWGEWAYDPPDECDACNNHGDWVGPQRCPPRGWHNFWSGLCGSRFHTACGSPTCTDCAVSTNPGYDTGVFSDSAPGEVWVDQSPDSYESGVPASSPDDLPSESVLREARKPTPAKHPASRLVRRGRTSEVK
ncbi:MAG: hypothetical protein ACYC3X_00685 [Pirellulaceae bacterium]